MARTTQALVRQILTSEDCPDDPNNLGPSIDAANLMVTEACGDAGYSASLLTSIETYLAAAIWTSRGSQGVVRSRTSFDQSESYFANTRAAGFLTNSYGEIANTLSKGLLASSVKPRPVFVTLA